MYQVKSGFSQNQNYKDPGGELEEELLGGCHGNEVTSYAWFHGALPGDQAEKLLKRNGQFVVRSVTSQLIGECFLSVRYDDKFHHLKIHRYVEQVSANYSSIKFKIGKNPQKENVAMETFDNIPSLVTFYNRKKIPSHDVIISEPVPRKNSIVTSHNSDYDVTKCNSVSSSVTSSNSSPDSSKSSGSSWKLNHVTSPFSDVIDVTSQVVAKQPPKPTRKPTLVKKDSNLRFPKIPEKQNRNIKSANSFTSQTSNTNLNNNTKPVSLPPKTRRRNKTETNRQKRRSQFDPLSYQSQILSQDNKPMDEVAMKKTIKILLETDTYQLARHLTYMDCKICKIMEDGLEEIFLQKGKDFRQDLLERYQSTAFWVIICIVRGGINLEHRTKILNIFIQIASEPVVKMGNLFINISTGSKRISC